MASSIIPTMRYRDARTMIAWLCDTFGFQRHAVHEGEDGGIVHAELVLGDGMVMLGDARDDAFGALQAPPTGNGPVTQSPYVIVEDIEQLYAAARAAGAAAAGRAQAAAPRPALPQPQARQPQAAAAAAQAERDRPPPPAPRDRSAAGMSRPQ